MSVLKQKNMRKQNLGGMVRREDKDSEEMSFGVRGRKQRVPSPSIFISKTFEILENQEYQDIIRWNPDGATFIISEVDKFQQQVLPLFFRHRNFSSFVRQLNMYDFHKIRNDANKNIFEHKDFRRSCRDRLKNIRRKGCNGKKQSNRQETLIKEEDDDLYRVPQKSSKAVLNTKAYVQNSDSSIAKYPSANNISAFQSRSSRSSPVSNSPIRRRLIQEFLESLPEKVKNETEIENILRQMKKNPRYECLNSNEEMRKIVKRIKQLKLPKQDDKDLDDLSIQQQILVENVNGLTLHNPSLAIFSTEKCLPMRSMSLIGSLNMEDDVENLLYPYWLEK